MHRCRRLEAVEAKLFSGEILNASEPMVCVVYVAFFWYSIVASEPILSDSTTPSRSDVEDRYSSDSLHY